MILYCFVYDNFVRVIMVECEIVVGLWIFVFYGWDVVKEIGYKCFVL